MLAAISVARESLRWRREVLAYFLSRLTNARTEGVNGKAKLVIRRADGQELPKLQTAAGSCRLVVGS